jgi:O-antigen ligase
VLFASLLVCIGIVTFKYPLALAFKNRLRMMMGLGAVGGAFALLFGCGLFGKVAGRLSTISDPSAGFRFQSLRAGLEAIAERPLLGIGYNFISHMKLWIDSSLFAITICCGVVATLCLLFVGTLLLKQLYVKWRQTQYRVFVSCFCAYVAIAVVFFSFFNQLVCYPFWLIPVIAIYQFFANLPVRHQNL